MTVNANIDVRTGNLVAQQDKISANAIRNLLNEIRNKIFSDEHMLDHVQDVLAEELIKVGVWPYLDSI